MITVLCATKGEQKPVGLEFVPVNNDAGIPVMGATISVVPNSDYHECHAKPWAVAANTLLDGCPGDALFLDDDIELTPWAFSQFERYRGQADIIGFSLFRPTAQGLALQSAGFQFMKTGDGAGAMLMPLTSMVDLLRPCYVAHVTASCMYLSDKVIRSGLRFPVWPGQHHEDVAFTYEAWLRGFKVMHLPGLVIHHMPDAGTVGATKSKDAGFENDRMVNWAMLQKWQVDNNIMDEIGKRIPLGAVPVI